MFQPKRSINLGNRKPQSKADVLKNANQLREQRLKLRQEENAAVKIQQIFRAKLLLNELRLDFANAFFSFKNPQLLDFLVVLPVIESLQLEKQIEILKMLSNSHFCKSDLLVKRVSKLLKNVHLRGLVQDILAQQQPLKIDFLTSVWPLIDANNYHFLLTHFDSFLFVLGKIDNLGQVDPTPFYNQRVVPLGFHKEKLRLLSILPNFQKAQVLVTAVLKDLPPLNTLYKDELCSTEMIANAVNLAEFGSLLFYHFKLNRKQILLKLSVNLKFTEVWRCFFLNQNERMLNFAVEFTVFQLVVSLDLELKDLQDELLEIALFVKQQCLEQLLNFEEVEENMLMLLRQLYQRDQRLNLFGNEFWPVNMDFETMQQTPILEQAPFLVPLEKRVALLYKLIDNEKGGVERFVDREQAVIDRERMVEDTKREFLNNKDILRNGIRVQMVSDGSAEAGVDGGGIMKDLLLSVCDLVFKKDKGECTQCFVQTDMNMLYPNPIYDSIDMPTNLKEDYTFLGLVIGKCIYEKLLVNLEFEPTFLSKLKQKQLSLERNTIDDLASLDPQLHHALTRVCLMPQHELEEAMLDFTIQNSKGEVVELVKDGRNIMVNENNKLEYAWRVANYKLNTAIRMQTQQFLFGVSQVVNLQWLNMFSNNELNKIIGGSQHGLDVDDLKRFTTVNGFPPNSKAVEYLWEVLNEFDLEQAGMFLRFCTSVPRSPLLGFVDMNPRFAIRCSGRDQGRYPTAATCYNMLKLPDYMSKDTLRERLLDAMKSGMRFDLS